MTDHARRLIEFQLGNYLKKMDHEGESLSDEERASYAGKVVGLSEALDLLEAAENGTTVNDLGIGAQTVADYRDRAKEYRNEDNAENQQKASR